MFNYEKIIDELQKEVIFHYQTNLVSIALFGSVARDLHRPDSDIDFLIIAENLPRGRMKRILDFSSTIEKKLDPLLDTFVYNGTTPCLSPLIKTKEEVKLGGYIYLDMVEDAKILYDNENFFYNYLINFKQKMNQWGSKKIPHKNSYYWIVKPDLKEGEIINFDT